MRDVQQQFLAGALRSESNNTGEKHRAGLKVIHESKYLWRAGKKAL